MIRKCKTLYPYKLVNQKFQPHSRDCTRVSKDRGSDSRACNTYISNAYVYNACTHRKTEGRSNVSHTHQQQTSLDSNFACCSTRALRRSPFCGRAEGERERGREGAWLEGLLEFPAGICLIGNRHGRPSSPLHPTAPSARSHPRGNASRATCTSVFRPVTLILSLHPSKESTVMDLFSSSNLSKEEALYGRELVKIYSSIYSSPD